MVWKQYFSLEAIAAAGILFSLLLPKPIAASIAAMILLTFFVEFLCVNLGILLTLLLVNPRQRMTANDIVVVIAETPFSHRLLRTRIKLCSGLHGIENLYSDDWKSADHLLTPLAL